MTHDLRFQCSLMTAPVCCNISWAVAVTKQQAMTAFSSLLHLYASEDHQISTPSVQGVLCLGYSAQSMKCGRGWGVVIRVKLISTPQYTCSVAGGTLRHIPTWKPVISIELEENSTSSHVLQLFTFVLLKEYSVE